MNENFKWIAVEDYLSQQKHRSVEYKDYKLGEFNIESLVDIFQKHISSVSSAIPHSIKVFKCSTFSAVVKIISNHRLTTFGIVYDYGLLEIFNSLNIFYFHLGDRVDYKKYIYKLLAEFFYNKNMIVDSLKLTKQYSSIKYSINNNLLNTEKTTARNYAAIQMLFIIFHEFCHMLLKQDMISDYEKESKNIIKHIIINFRNKYKSMTRNSIHYDLLSELCNRDEIIEECFCDMYALEIILSLYRNNNNSTEIIEAIYLALSHQKYIELVKCKTDIIENYSTTLNIRLRESCAKALLPIIFMKIQCNYDWTNTDFINNVEKAIISENNSHIMTISKRINIIEEYYSSVLSLEWILNILSEATSKCSYSDNVNWSDETKQAFQSILEELI
jgi:hypothetical protein